MNIAMPVWGGRLSPVFDTAETLLVVELVDGRPADRFRHRLSAGNLTNRVTDLQDAEAGVLLCGAISRPLFDMVVTAGIEVVPFLAGRIDDLLEAFLRDRLADPTFQMPGCCHHRRMRRAGRRGG